MSEQKAQAKEPRIGESFGINAAVAEELFRSRDKITVELTVEQVATIAVCFRHKAETSCNASTFSERAMGLLFNEIANVMDDKFADKAREFASCA